MVVIFIKILKCITFLLTFLDDGLDNTSEEVTLVNGGISSVNGDTVLANSGEQVTSKKTNRNDTENENGAVETENEGEDEQKVFYDKTKSFFDTISCEAVERSKGYYKTTNCYIENYTCIKIKYVL